MFDEIEVATQVSEQVLVYDWTVDRVEDGALELDAALVGRHHVEYAVTSYAVDGYVVLFIRQITIVSLGVRLYMY